MSRNVKSGLGLVVLGLIGALFFVASDPRIGWLQGWMSSPNPIDAANEMYLGTVVGMVCSSIVFLAGVWLMTRKAM